MSLLLADEAVSGEAELCDARVPDVLHQSPDSVSFRYVVRRAADRQDGDKQTLRHGSVPSPVSTGQDQRNALCTLYAAASLGGLPLKYAVWLLFI